jgi:hypothetical protein
MKLTKYKRELDVAKQQDNYNPFYFQTREYEIFNLQLEIENLERQIKIKKLSNKMVQKVDE